ncbi:MAG: hypothetical protein M1820_003441 [Bogoriella megaspora]|nr:MAG: hypothetical protein M1820_003441 [Bogoriella megaspora]
MLGAHRRTRSLIPVKNMDKYEKKIEVVEVEVEDEPEYQTQAPAVKDKDRQLRLIYLTLLAAGLMVSSAEPQIRRLSSSDSSCGSLMSSYLESVLKSAFSFGGALGLLSGFFVDRIGRKPIVISSLLSMAVLSGIMSFARTLATCACIRLILGGLSSSIAVAGICMLGDLCRNRAERVRLVAPIPFIMACGSVFVGLQEGLVNIFLEVGFTENLDTSLAAQCFGGLFAFFVAMSSYAKLEETAPIKTIVQPEEPIYHDDEKAAFLCQEEEDISPAISVVDFDQNPSSVPGPFALFQLLRAPSLITLLVSISFFALHMSAFDILIPSIILTVGDQKLSCSMFSLLNLASRLAAGYLTTRVLLPALSRRDTTNTKSSSLISEYRILALVGPAIYILTAITAGLLPASSPAFLTHTVTTLLLFLRHTFEALLIAFVVLLTLSASPDAFSTGSVTGLVSLASLLRGFSCAAVGAGFWVSEEYKLDFLQVGGHGAGPGAALWLGMILIGLVGGLVARAVKEGVSVGEDFEGGKGLKWVGVWDVEGQGEGVIYY